MQPTTSKTTSRWILARSWLIAIPLCVGLLAFGWSRWQALAVPTVEAPETVDLGSHENNKFVQTEVCVRNTGYRPLELSRFRVSCPSCLSFGIPSGSGITEIEERIIAPGESLTLAARIRIYGSPEIPFRVALICATNDPNRPELSISFDATVHGQVFVAPAELDIGTLKPGQTVRKVVELRDSGRGSPCTLRRAVSPAPDIVQLKLLPSPPKSEARGVEKRSSEIIGILEVTVAAPTAVWALDDSISVFEEGRDQPLVTIPIRSRVLAPVQVTPSSVVFPRVVAGEDVFTADCAFSSTTSHALLDVQPLEVPVEISVDPLGLDRSRAGYRIEWRKDHLPAKGESRSVTVRFRVKTEAGNETIDVRVRCRTPD